MNFMSYFASLLAYGPWGLVVLRAVAGTIFIVHGIPKLFGPSPGIAGFTAWLRSMYVPLAGFFGLLVPLTEFFGGIALIVGFLVQPVALLLAIEMVVAGALKKMKMGKGFSGDGGWEFDLILAAAMIILLTSGAGAFALDAWMGW